MSVTVSGTISAGTNPITTGTYAVIDSYSQDQPTGSVTLGMDDSYSFAIALIAAREGNNPSGRTYTINVNGSDKIGNVGTCSSLVTVPHDQGE
jgi:broad specificity polyphosphatase/5'/3'-nucleotidase SurE